MTIVGQERTFPRYSGFSRIPENKNQNRWITKFKLRSYYDCSSNVGTMCELSLGARIIKKTLPHVFEYL